jgi:hypothetical protein
MEDLKIQMICRLVSEVSLTTRSGAMLLQRIYKNGRAALFQILLCFGLETTALSTSSF